MIEIVSRYSFGADSASNTLLGRGWSEPTLDGTWMQSPSSDLNVPLPTGRGQAALELDIDPQIAWPHPRPQTIRVRSGRMTLSEHTVAGPLTWRVELPASLDVKGSLALTLDVTARGDKRDDRGIRLRSLTVLRLREAPLPQATKPLAALHFGWNGTANSQLDEGWGEPEDGYVWAVGGRSTMRLPLDGTGAACLVLIDMRPFKHEKAPPAQRVAITVAGMPTRNIVLVERLIIALPVAPQNGQREVCLQFDNEDADFESSDPLFHYGRPFAWAISCVRIVPDIAGTNAGFRPRAPGRLADGTLQAFVQRLAGIDARSLVAGFEGLGNGCELGNFQIAMGHDQPGLLRYCAIRQRELVEGLFAGFAGVCRIDRMNWSIRREEDDTWRLIEDTYGISAATPYNRDIPPPEDGQRAASIRSPWLAGKLMHEIAEAAKIFVVRISEHVDESAIMAVLAALRHYGDARLLWLVTDGSLPPGSVERLPNGLLRGHLDSPATGREIPPETIMGVLANAWVLIRQAA